MEADLLDARFFPTLSLKAFQRIFIALESALILLVPSPRSRLFPWRSWLDVAAIGSWGALLLTYWRTGQLALLVHPLYNGLIVAAGMLLLIASTFAGIKIVRGRSPKRTGDEEHLTVLPPTLTSGILLAAAILGLLIAPKPLASAKAMQQQTSASVTVTRSNPQSFRANRDPAERSLVEWVRLLNVYPEPRSEEHTSELQSLTNLVCRLLLEKKKKTTTKKRSEEHTPEHQKIRRRTQSEHQH